LIFLYDDKINNSIIREGEILMSCNPDHYPISVILHFSENLPYGTEQFSRILDSVFNQTHLPDELLIIGEERDGKTSFEAESIKTQIIRGDHDTQAKWLNAALEKATGDYIIYIDNQSAEVSLKLGYLDAALLAIVKYPKLGMLYTDYELVDQGITKEIHLLKHHQGRVRDNQDYGRVFLFSRKALKAVGDFDESVKFNALYDIRLKLSEQHQLVHLANRYAGSLYTVVAPGEKANVFDYLLASKDSQLEAEKVVSEHLKRIGAYLAPGAYYKARLAEDAELAATVIIPVNHRPQFIPAALESVFNQTVQNIEVIVVVNGGYNDPTIPEVQRYLPGGDRYDASKPEVRLIVTDINNIGLCLNLGAQAARGQYYIQLDSDDRLKPIAVEKVIEKFDEDEQIGMVIGSYEVWQLDEKGNYSRMENLPVVTHDEWTAENGRNNLLRINGAGAPRCILFDVIKEVGYFGINDEPYARNYGEDYDLVLKISERYQIGRIWEAIYEVVRHAGGTDHSIDQATVDRNDEAKDYMRLETIKRRILLNQKRAKGLKD
jgi:glycosyltransferase involved in cell wall biosynthesis